MEDVPCEVIDRSFDKWRDVTEWYEGLWNFCSICDYVLKITKDYPFKVRRRCLFCPLPGTGFCASSAKDSKLHPGYYKNRETILEGAEYLEPALKKWRKYVEEFLDFLWPYTSYSEKDKR